MNHKHDIIKAIVVLTALLGAFGAVWLWLVNTGLVNDLSDLIDIYSDRQRIRAFIKDAGEAAPLVFIFLQAIQVIIAPIPGELTGSIAGFLFNGFWGSLYATGGLMLGSSAAFLLGRYLGQPFINLLTSEEQRQKFGFVAHKRGGWLIFIVFLIPGFPKDILTYLFSLTPVNFWRFFWISQLGRLPGTVLLTYFGAAIFEGNWIVMALTAIGAMTGLLLILWYRNRILKWLKESSR